MSYILDKSTHVIRGLTFKVAIEQDDCQERPWKACDGHGPVREVSKGYYDRYVTKRPGERVLHNGDRDCYSWVYDWNGAMALAMKDGWGVSESDRPANWESLTKRQRCELAVQHDFDFLKAWCDQEWVWAGVCVTLVIEDEDGDLVEYEGPLTSQFHDSLWGVEFWQWRGIDHSKNSYANDIANELCDAIAKAYLDEQAELLACEERDIVTEA